MCDDPLQYPVRLAFCMTINESQGQSLKCVGVNIREEVFSHGQLYVLCGDVLMTAHRVVTTRVFTFFVNGFFSSSFFYYGNDVLLGVVCEAFLFVT
jgi:hypothetical protein